MSEFKFMSIKINYKNNISKNKPKNVVFFVDEKFSIAGIKNLFRNQNILTLNIY